MTKKSEDLEQLVTRIHKLIEPSGAVVEWDHRQEDPDTGRLRQIDARILRDGKSVHVECRAHKEPQDVQWIEELIGRRASLQVDGIIAVSSSGFRATAVKKARAYGISTRTLSEMTDDEIKAWGASASVKLNYIKIKELELVPFINARDIPAVTDWPELNVDGPVPPLLAILENVSTKTHDKFVEDRDTIVNMTAVIGGLRVDEASVIKIDVRLKGRLYRDNVSLLGVWNYRRDETNDQSDATVSKLDFGSTEIIQNKDQASMLLDFSVIAPPKNCFLQTFQVDFGRQVNASFDVVGLPKTLILEIDSVLDVKAIDFEALKQKTR